MSFRVDIAALVAANSYGALASGDGWPRVRLGEVAQVINGFAFQSKYFSPDEGVPLVRIRDVVDGRSITRYSGPVPDGYDVEDGDLLVGMDGDFNCAYWRGGPALLNQRVCRICPDERRLRRKFLGYALPAYLKLINDHTSSVTVKHLSSRTLQDLPIPVPSLAVQDGIVIRIDELFSEISDGERALKSAKEAIETYRRSLLNSAMSGELTADWRSQNSTAFTGADFLIDLLRQQQSRWERDPKNKRKKYSAPLVPDTSALIDLPDGWTWASVGQLIDGVEAGLNVKAEGRPPVGAELGIVKISAVTWDVFNENESKALPPSQKVDLLHLIRPGDFLFSRANTLELVGAPAIVGALTRRILLSDKVLRLRLPSELKRWLYFALKSPLGRHHIEARSTGNQLSMRNISQESLRGIPVPLPPLEELIFASELVQNLWEANAQLGKYLNAEDHSSELRQSILAAAFRGDLVA